MAQNRVIKMYYELKDANSGEILESNFNANPIAFITGKEQIIQKLEDEVLSLGEGESKIVRISPSDGVGEYNENAIQILPKEEFAGIDLVVGMELFGQAEDGATTRVIVKAIGEEDVTIDFNHPFAGKELEFNVKVVENREPSEDELMTGVPEGEHTCGCGGHGHHHHGDHECCGGHGHHHHGDHECCGGHGHHHED
ncbi:MULTISPECIES: FKBP-type peptidyl-prolyl cis-trans isomerase [unclassified Campylobacter]|uniref:FKBP-type peptidyl-prolyl cis-trans isomerase n=1 Tax=unclassified Campylobacter TaxID=2593542 RepID=UPI0022E9F83D|nr:MULTISPECIES: peptidylprolyl isomerase [unclassified Campylobacter]MDA3062126.1 peptidylprolyl isomerase [Campylobacter sp. JMF_14 EL1]MDA3072770.1 peptidylprolyl isomerase [Campylobacter sp. JMF_10 EL2]